MQESNIDERSFNPSAFETRDLGLVVVFLDLVYAFSFPLGGEYSSTLMTKSFNRGFSISLNPHLNLFLSPVWWPTAYKPKIGGLSLASSINFFEWLDSTYLILSAFSNEDVSLIIKFLLFLTLLELENLGEVHTTLFFFATFSLLFSTCNWHFPFWGIASFIFISLLVLLSIHTLWANSSSNTTWETISGSLFLHL